MLDNLVLENANAPGTGAVTPAGAPSGRRTFAAAFGNGAKAYYVLTDGTQTEEGWTTVGTPMTRNVIWTSASGVTSTPLNFTGTCQIYNSLPAQRALWADQYGNWIAQNRIIGLLGAASYPDQAPRLDQIGSVRSATVAAANGALLLPIPALQPGSLSQLIEIEMHGMTASVNASYYFRVSVDNAASFLGGTSEYKYALFTMADGTSAENNGFASYVPLTASLDARSAMLGSLTYDQFTLQWSGRTVGINSATGRYIQNLSAGNSITNAPVTHILISAVGGALTGGQARITQKVF